MTYKGAFGRPNDTVGVAVEYARIGARARAGDVAVILDSGVPGPVRSSETVIEATYQAQITPWWQLQPDFQFILNPGAGISDLNNPARRIGNAAVFGLRSVVTF